VIPDLPPPEAFDWSYPSKLLILTGCIWAFLGLSREGQGVSRVPINGKLNFIGETKGVPPF
jgi:hypothetical protein